MVIQEWALDVWDFLKKHVIPDLFIKRRLNFITIHYLYMIGMSLVLSVIIYGIGDISYIDALFFASGSCTQSGLNTVDVNDLKTGQQAVMYLGAMMCNPIAVHSVVVFVRLYWFEKRFKAVVLEARKLRRTKSRNRATTKDDLENASHSLSIRGRVIQLLPHTGHRTGRNPQSQPDEKTESPPYANGKAVESPLGSQKDDDSSDEGPRQILPDDGHFPLSSSQSAEDVRLPEQRPPEQHILFLQNQRNPHDTTTLRIPSPREFERGSRPEHLDGIDNHLLRQITFDPDLPPGSENDNGDLHARVERAPTHITIDEPRMIRDRTDRVTTFPRVNTKRSNQQPSQDRAGPGPYAQRPRVNTSRSFLRSNTTRTMEPAPYLSWQPTIGRNSFFIDLTEDQREELGGIEYRSLKLLAKVLVAYFFLFHLFGALCLFPWILRSGTYGQVVDAVAQNRVWWGFFTSASAFNDLGFTLTPDSMISFQQAVWPLLLMTYLIVIGNTGFPCMLRAVIWIMSKLCRTDSPTYEELRFLLDHPRRCFTLLFPGRATWVLFGILVLLNGVDLIFFIILDLNDPTVTQMPSGIRFLAGLFQAAATRTAGFAVVNLADLHPAIQVSYLIMMYISVFPIAISMRRTNVYEEKSLGIYSSAADEGEDEKEASYVGAHLRRQLSFDLWYVFLGLFIIAIVEGSQLENTNEYAFTLFSVLFEIVSAYGTVGLSLGYPGTNTSFSAQFRTLSKLVMIAMQIRGRHRGLPYEVDRAILLPSESLQAKEAREGERIVMRRRRSSAGQSMISAVDGNLDGRHFRPETGLSSAVHIGEGEAYVRPFQPRTNTNRTDVSMSSNAEQHQAHHARPHSSQHGLGTAMFKLANQIDSIKEEKTRES